MFLLVLRQSENNMKISTLLAVGITALAALSGAVFYQHGGEAADHFKMIAQHLHLSPVQEKQLKGEHESAAKRVAAINADSRLDEKGKQAAIAELHTEMMEKSKSILTPAQMKELTYFSKSMEAQHQITAILDKIGLSKEQKESVHAMFAKTMTEMQAIHNDNKLTDAQKQEKAQQLHEKAMEQIHSILTPEQIEKAMKLHGGTGHGGGHK